MKLPSNRAVLSLVLALSCFALATSSWFFGFIFLGEKYASIFLIITLVLNFPIAVASLFLSWKPIRFAFKTNERTTEYKYAISGLTISLIYLCAGGGAVSILIILDHANILN
jgi:hypothetical protein